MLLNNASEQQVREVRFSEVSGTAGATYYGYVRDGVRFMDLSAFATPPIVFPPAPEVARPVRIPLEEVQPNVVVDSGIIPDNRGHDDEQSNVVADSGMGFDEVDGISSPQSSFHGIDLAQVDDNDSINDYNFDQ